MVKIRMSRIGRRNAPEYRICVYESTTRRNGPVLENLGHYHPRLKDPKKKVVVDADRLQHWVAHGAQVSEALAAVLRHAQILPGAPAAKA